MAQMQEPDSKKHGAYEKVAVVLTPGLARHSVARLLCMNSGMQMVNLAKLELP